MQRRVFIGINLPNQVKKRLMQKIEKWRELPVRWGSEDNLHITLSFLGYIDDENIAPVCAKVRSASEKSKIFDLILEEIILAPDAVDPRMIWLTGKPNEDLKKLQENIEKELGIFQRAKKAFRPHVTIGRIRKNKWKALSEIPEIQDKFNVVVPADSVQIFESVVENGKRKYLLLESCPLK
jgi:2'-5' RNA ligase